MIRQKNKWRVKRQQGSITFEGAFRAPGDIKILGRIIEHEDRPVDVYVWDPSVELRNHPQHGSCWQLLRPGDKWFYLHWEKPAWDFESGRVYVERMLAETFEAVRPN